MTIPATIASIICESVPSQDLDQLRPHGNITASLGCVERGNIVELGTSNGNSLINVRQPKIFLPALHERTVALQLSLSGQECLFKGRGVYEFDTEFGRILRVECPLDAQCEIWICEKAWNGEVQTGEAYGCDFLIRLS